MTTIRPAAVAGMFYPDDPRQLRHMIANYLDAVDADKRNHNRGETAPKAIIVPHAGYIYSGPIAASAYSRLQNFAQQISRVILIGPAHRVYFKGVAIPSCDQFATPLGSVTLDHEAIRLAANIVDVQVLDEPHVYEHSLEVHLPFLQTILKNFKLVPILAGDTTSNVIERVLDALWGGDETLIVISSDLSHYHDYATAKVMDTATSKAIETLTPQDIGEHDACGRIPIAGLLGAARRRGMHGHTIDVRNSGDTAGPRDRVVGYGAYVFAP